MSKTVEMKFGELTVKEWMRGYMLDKISLDPLGKGQSAEEARYRIIKSLDETITVPEEILEK